MKTGDLYNEIRDYCLANQDESNVKKYQRYFKEEFKAYGLSRGLVEAKAKEITSRPDMSLSTVLELAPLLLRSPKYEKTSIAILLLLSFHKQWTRETFNSVERWFAIGITNWAHADYLGGEVIPRFMDKKLIVMDTLQPWRNAKNKFQRRVAVVGLIKPMKRSPDFQAYFEFISPMMSDPEREVHQGLGWFLREAWKKQPGPTEIFLMKWKDTAPRLIFQYATEKMTTEGKLRFRKQK